MSVQSTSEVHIRLRVPLYIGLGVLLIGLLALVLLLWPLVPRLKKLLSGDREAVRA